MTPPGSELTEAGAHESEERLDRALVGSLPCIGCGYELQGLSVRVQCPECGLAIRATILHCVDPHADVFQPLKRPKLIATGLVLTSMSASVSAMSALALRAMDLLERWGIAFTHPNWLSMAPAMAIALCGVSTTLYLHPTASTTRRKTISAVIAALAFIPLAAAMWALHVGFDSTHAAPYLVAGAQRQRIALRLLIGAMTLVILVGIRPNCRSLVARSLVMRTGRVDRQTMAAIGAAVALAAAGDGVRLLSLSVSAPRASIVESAGTIAVVIGSLLITLALVGAVIDTFRMGRAILTPAPSMDQLLNEPKR